MAYAILSQLKEYLGVSDTGDDVLLADLLDRATAAIESYCRRRFVASTEERRFYHALGRLLLLHDDLLSVSAITNGDGTAVTDYILWPDTQTPKVAVIRTQGRWEASAAAPIIIAGQWGFSALPPGDIVHACLRLAGYYYRQRDAQVFDVTAEPALGIITIPKGIPADVAQVLAPYVRPAYVNA